MELLKFPMTSIYDSLAQAEYRIEDDPEGPTLRMYKPDKDGCLERVNAFIRPDKALVVKRGIEVYARLNMPDEDRAKLMKWLGISELKHT